MKNLFTLENIFSLLEEAGITIYEYKENNKLYGYELNTYTRRGVNQILFLDFRDTGLNPENPQDFLESFFDRIKDIDIDEEIEIHRQMKDYKESFTIRQSLEDFEEWKNNLQLLAHRIFALKYLIEL